MLNLPASFIKAGPDPIGLHYTHDANGRRLRRYDAVHVVVTDYVDGIQYDNNAIDFIQTEEGIAKKDEVGVYKYHYNLSDFTLSRA